MEIIIATKSTTPIIGQLATIMGWIMTGIYNILNGLFGVQNIGLCIIIFSIVIYALMTPLQIQQQKFSKLSAIMQPEIKKIQKKYENKKDQESMQRMNEETQMVYKKYGVSSMGSCIQLLIQMPILFALYQVIYKIPAYVGSVKDVFADAVTNITSVSGYTDIINTFISDNNVSRVTIATDSAGLATSNSVVDFLYALSPSQWKSLAEISEFSSFTDVIDTAASKISNMQYFLGLNLADTPWYYIRNAFVGGSIILAIVAVLIPVLSWATQMLNIRLMPTNTSSGGNEQADAMASSMKTMNMTMPLMSAFFCFTFPVGLGIYWVSSAVVRSVQQVLINRHLNKMDIDDLVNENMKKMEKQREKEGLPPQKITTQAHQNVKNINTRVDKENSNRNVDERTKKVDEAYQKSRNAKPGSITAKANMVRDYNERNKKK